MPRSNPPSGDQEPAPAPDPDSAWKTLGLMNEWIRHSDTKAGVTLAFTGALATMTFNLVKDFTHRSTSFDVLVVITCGLLAATGALCGWTLTPRVKDKNPEAGRVNHLYFASIAQHFDGRRQQYRDELTALVADPSELTRELADQIHANSRIATTKTRCAKWAIRSALAAGAAVAVLAIAVGVGNS